MAARWAIGRWAETQSTSASLFWAEFLTSQFGVETVFRLDVRPVDLGDFDWSGERLVLRLELGFHRLIAVPVDHVQRQRAVVVPGGGVQVRHVAEAPAFVRRTLQK